MIIFVSYFSAMAMLLVFSAFFSASETALFSLSRRDLHKFEDHPGFVERTVVRLRSGPQDLLATVLFGNMLVNTLYCSLGTLASFEAAAAIGAAAGLVVGVGSLAVLILGGEVVPKAVAVGAPVRMARLVALPLSMFHQLLSTARVLRALSSVANLCSWPFLCSSGPAPHVTWEELQKWTNAEVGAAATAGGGDIAHELVDAPDTRVLDVMIPRAEVAVVGLDAGREEISGLVRERRVTTILVCDGSPDRLVGVVDAAEVLLGTGRVRDHVRLLPLVVTGDEPIENVLDRFREEGYRLAVVEDEHGVWSGVVTLEDAVEEICLLLRLGRLPDKGDMLRFGDLVFTVQGVDGRRVTGLRCERLGGSEQGGSA